MFNVEAILYETSIKKLINESWSIMGDKSLMSKINDDMVGKLWVL